MNDLILFAILFASILLLGILNTISRNKHMMLAVKAVKAGKSTEEVRALLKKEPDGPEMRIFNRIGKIILIAVLLFWSNMWFSSTSVTLPSEWQKPIIYAVFGFQAAVATIVFLRSILMIVSTFTDSIIIEAIANKNSPWETLETRLLIASCLSSLVAGFIPVYFIVKQS